MFEKKHPNCDGVWIFDNSSCHNFHFSDSLTLAKFNLKPGGSKRDKVRDGVLPNGDSQSMYFKVGDVLLTKVSPSTQISFFNDAGELVPRGLAKDLIIESIGDTIEEGSNLIGVAKGVFQILMERGVNEWETKCISKDVETCDCSRCQLHRFEDFLNAPGALEEIFSTLPHHHLLMLPKFHPELNAIERVWGKMKLILRSYFDSTPNGEVSVEKRFIEMIKTVGDYPYVTSTLFQKYFMLCDRWVTAYEDEDDVVKVEQLVKRKSSHRGIVESVERHLLEDLLN